ncbi:MAG: tryptophan-rich sensory protein [Oscillatoria sp. PMC 1068.18]|nr:tryptophan-rich sensory protein [Oscillatoria sp. PMC 1076.18]MEC4990485.1 tryptophan-rich sensory protein [Oscillatoria sp. PMC 1068.18]
MKFDRDLLRQIFNLTAIISAFGINIWANLAPIKGLTIGEISQQIFGNVLITPASYAFVIWGVIYLGLISFAVYQVLPTQRSQEKLRRLGYSLVFASLAQIVWVFLFLSRWFVLSLGAMIGILLSLITGYLKLRTVEAKFSRQERWWIVIPLSIYLSWISVATILNVAIALSSVNWDGWGISPVVWTAVMIAVAGIIGATVIKQRRDRAFGLVLIWALIAIAVRHREIVAIAATAIIVAFALILVLFFQFWRSRHHNFKSASKNLKRN